MSSKNRSMSSLGSDEAAEDFIATTDLTKYDLSGFRLMRFEIEPKTTMPRKISCCGRTGR
ncbi:CopG family antitoxin [Acetobacter senegalensis]|uniref:CopG family antitoxin n=1 Tax=Acetobacter senegalensis TaxID=446692 RepID=UPI001EE06463|nr:CopG family antitoxin [Acetobacter senegalensis]